MVRVRAGAIALAVGSLLVLTACGGGEAGPTAAPSEPVGVESVEPSPTPSPTSGAYVSPAPTSEADAIAHATRAYEFYLATLAEVVAGDADVSKIDEVAVGDASNSVHNMITTLRSGSAQLTFEDSFESDPGDAFAITRTTAAGETPFGEVHLLGCLDMSGRSGVNGDGSAVVLPDPNRIVVEVTVLFELSDQTWRVLSDAGVPGPDGPTTC